jgi:hypothetical protein
MKPGQLAEICVPIPMMFEPLTGDPTTTVKAGDLVILVKNEPTAWWTPCWRVLFNNQIGVISSRWIKEPRIKTNEYLIDEEESNMSLNAGELITLLPEAQELVKVLSEALKKDPDGKVRVTKEEGKQIKAIISRLALQLAKDVID